MTVVISGDGTITGLTAGGLPDATITQAELASNVAGNGPAFSAYVNTNQSVTSNTFTKVQFNTEEFDTNSNYDKDTNYRFQPTVAGYYQINAGIAASGVSVTRLIACLYKNGANYKNGYDVSGSPNKGGVSSLVYLNGSSDYVEVYTYITGTSPVVFANSDWSNSWFNGAMVRAA